MATENSNETLTLEEISIWPASSGIQNLPEHWRPLQIPEMRTVQTEWANRLTEWQDSPELSDFIEQYSREWAIETGVIENLYEIERGATRTLIQHGFQAALIEEGASNIEPNLLIQYLNDQKDALEGLFAFVKQDRKLSTSYIRELHAALTRSQVTYDAYTPDGQLVRLPLLHGAYKTEQNHPQRDGKIFLYCPMGDQTTAEMERLVVMHLEHTEIGIAPEVEAAWLHHRFTQIHPFQDGNGRVARALASLVLIRARLFPLVIDRDRKNEYIRLLEQADQGELKPLIYLFARRQQEAFRKTSDLLVRLAPPSTSIAEAGKKLALAFRNRTDTIADRMSHRLESILKDLPNRLTEQMGAVLVAVKEVHPSATLSFNSGPVKERIIPDIQVACETRFATAIIPPIHYVKATLVPFEQAPLFVVLAPMDADLDDSIVVIGLMIKGDEYLALPAERFVWPEFDRYDPLNSQWNTWIENLGIVYADGLRKLIG